MGEFSAGKWIILAGCFFFFAGTVGLLRFPDPFTRLHALTKADNLGLGFIATGLALDSGSIVIDLKLIAIWLLAMLASSSACHLVGRSLLLSPAPERKEGK